jgi:hypothetical protein
MNSENLILQAALNEILEQQKYIIVTINEIKEALQEKN